MGKPVYADGVLNDPDYSPAKHMKMNMPVFDGTDAEHWIFAVRRYFIYNKVLEDQKLLIVSFHLTRIARKWFAWLEASNMLSTWPNFVDAVIKKFTKLHYQLPSGKLSKLCQVGSVTDYIEEFQEMCVRVLGIPPYFILEMFISGLKEEIQIDVVLGKPGDIHEAFKLALLIESRRSPNSIVTYKSLTHKQHKPATYSSTQPNKGEVVGHQSVKPMGENLNLKRLSPQERAERRSKGLCFNCDEKFSANHNSVCKGRKGKLFRLAADNTTYIEIEEQEEIEEVAGTGDIVEITEG